MYRIQSAGAGPMWRVGPQAQQGPGAAAPPAAGTVTALLRQQHHAAITYPEAFEARAHEGVHLAQVHAFGEILTLPIKTCAHGTFEVLDTGLGLKRNGAGDWHLLGLPAAQQQSWPRSLRLCTQSWPQNIVVPRSPPVCRLTQQALPAAQQAALAALLAGLPSTQRPSQVLGAGNEVQLVYDVGAGCGPHYGCDYRAELFVRDGVLHGCRASVPTRDGNWHLLADIDFPPPAPSLEGVECAMPSQSSKRPIAIDRAAARESLARVDAGTFKPGAFSFAFSQQPFWILKGERALALTPVKEAWEKRAPPYLSTHAGFLRWVCDACEKACRSGDARWVDRSIGVVSCMVHPGGENVEPVELWVRTDGSALRDVRCPRDTDRASVLTRMHESSRQSRIRLNRGIEIFDIERLWTRFQDEFADVLAAQPQDVGASPPHDLLRRVSFECDRNPGEAPGGWPEGAARGVLSHRIPLPRSEEFVTVWRAVRVVDGRLRVVGLHLAEAHSTQELRSLMEAALADGSGSDEATPASSSIELDAEDGV